MHSKSRTKAISMCIMNYYHLIILDASGSMDCIRRTAVNGCNETIQTVRNLQKNHVEDTHYLSLVLFNSDNRTRTLYDCVRADEIADVPFEDYIPDGCTPLYDCIGLSVCHLQDQMKKTASADKQVLVTIITDGEENSSTLFDARKVKSLVEEQKHQGWTFVLIGANIDEVLEGDKIGIHNTMAFEQTDRGTRRMAHDYAESVKSFCINAPMMNLREKETGFFKKVRKHECGD